MSESESDSLAAIASSVRALCAGHPHAKIAWPHRDLHAIADLLEALQRTPEPVAWRGIESAPRDGTQILIAGTWRPLPPLSGGETAYCLARWSTLRANNREHRWISDGFRDPFDDHVDWSHWMHLPAQPLAALSLGGEADNQKETK